MRQQNLQQKGRERCNRRANHLSFIAQDVSVPNMCLINHIDGNVSYQQKCISGGYTTKPDQSLIGSAPQVKQTDNRNTPLTSRSSFLLNGVAFSMTYWKAPVSTGRPKLNGGDIYIYTYIIFSCCKDIYMKKKSSSAGTIPKSNCRSK